MDLTDEQQLFFKRHGIPLKKVFDATGFPRAKYQEAMRNGGYVVAVGVSPCKKGGHRIRTRGGHCAQCNPAALSFQSRHNSLGYVYLAQCGDFIKIGITSNPDDRSQSINSQSYGGKDEWIMRDVTLVNDAGSIESQIHNSLKSFITTEHTRKEFGKKQATYELFKCSYQQAKKAYREAIETQRLKK